MRCPLVVGRGDRLLPQLDLPLHELLGRFEHGLADSLHRRDLRIAGAADHLEPAGQLARHAASTAERICISQRSIAELNEHQHHGEAQRDSRRVEGDIQSAESTA